MFKRLATVLAASVGLAGAAIAADVPANKAGCMEVSLKLSDNAAAAKLSDDKLGKVDDLLTKLEGHCDAGKFKEAGDVAKEIETTIGN